MRKQCPFCFHLNVPRTILLLNLKSLLWKHLRFIFSFNTYVVYVMFALASIKSHDSHTRFTRTKPFSREKSNRRSSAFLQLTFTINLDLCLFFRTIHEVSKFFGTVFSCTVKSEVITVINSGNINNPMYQSKLELIACPWRKAWETICEPRLFFIILLSEWKSSALF